MDNFQRKSGRKPNNSFDGMLMPRDDQPKTQVGGGFRNQSKSSSSSTPDQPLMRNRLDNFRAADGFHPAKQPVLRESEPVNPRMNGRNPQRNNEGLIDLSLPPSSTKPSRGKKKAKRSWKRVALRSFAGLTVFVMLIVGFLFAKGYLNLQKIFKGGAEGAAALQDGVDPSRLKGEGDGRVNILMLGRGGEGHEAPDLTDTILIASLDPVNKTAALLSIPRDLWVTPEGYGSMKINAVFANAKYAAQYRKASAEEAEDAGFAAIEKEITEDIGIPIHYHVMVDFTGFEQAINTVGGIDINVDKDGEVYEVLWNERTHKNYTLNVTAGPQHFDGQRALFYARSRHTSPRGDFDRAERQRKILIALKEKILSLGTFSNPTKVNQLMDAFGNHAQANMTIKEVMRLYDIGKSINSDSVATVGLADPPNNYVQTDNVNGQSIVRPRAGLTDFSEIQNYVRNALKDGFIANENASIAVYNGTGTPGLASKKAAELKSYGYNVSVVTDAPTKNYTKTVFVDLHSGQKKYTKHYLEQRLGVTAVTTMPDAKITPPTGTDFVIILGQDAAPSTQ